MFDWPFLGGVTIVYPFFICVSSLQPSDHQLGKGRTHGSLVCSGFLCFSLSHLVSRVRCGTWLYRFLLVAFSVTLR